MADPGVGSFTPINIFAMIRALVNNGCPIVSNAGAPTSGTSGTFVGQAGPGAVLIDYTNAVLYINTNTLASPTWTKIVSNTGGGSVVVASGKTFTVNNTLTLAGTDATTMTFPTTSATLARTDAANTFTGVQTMTSAALTTPAITGAVTGTYTLTSPTITTPIFTDYKVLAATTTATTTTAATLTGFSWTVVAGTYIFEMNLPTTMTTNGGLTLSFLLTTAVLTSIQYQSYASTASDNTTGVSTQGTTATSGTKVFDSKTAAYTYVRVVGSMVVGTGGTFTWQACQNTAAGGGDTTSVLLGGYSKLERVA